MSQTEKPYDDIPGTYVMDGKRARQGYHLNRFCMTLLDPKNREAFAADEAAYLEQFPLTDAQRKAVLERDWLGMLHEGGNIFYTLKLAIHDGKSMQYLGGQFTGVTEEEFRQMMINGGRPAEGNRSRSEQEEN